MSDASQFDHYLTDGGPAALVIREPLAPVEGDDGVLFPATFAEIGYNIDIDASDRSVCLVDSVGSQANRIEPIFKEEKYKALVPQIAVKAGDKELNILDAGHRAGDALVRCTQLKDSIDAAFRSVLNGNCEPLAKLAPTSLVFGVWNSRGEQGLQAKLPRLIASTIRAYDVQVLTRSANYLVQQQVDYIRDGIMPEWEELPDGEKKKLSEKGYQNALANRSHGGIIARGGVRRDAVLGLAALRLLAAGNDKDQTRMLQRYILGLALVAFTHNPTGYLRQGCLLVLNPSAKPPRTFEEVYSNGERKPADVNHDQALAYATAAAAAFGVGESRNVAFEKERAKKDVTADGEGKGKGKKGKKADDGGTK